MGRAGLLLLLLPLAAAQTADTFTSREQGFRIGKPDAPWTLKETAPAPGTTYTLKLGGCQG